MSELLAQCVPLFQRLSGSHLTEVNAILSLHPRCVHRAEDRFGGRGARVALSQWPRRILLFVCRISYDVSV